jgi:hypothetical protein
MGGTRPGGRRGRQGGRDVGVGIGERLVQSEVGQDGEVVRVQG